MRRMMKISMALMAAMILSGAARVAQQRNEASSSGSAAAALALPAATPAPLIAQDLEAWLDGMMPSALQRTNIAGGAVVVVKDGRIVLQKGYGYSDVAKRTPVDPQRTIFRPGSVAKLFTWTAVMQQVEQGKIDLDADVNKYLDFKIPHHDGRAVTMRMLMNHNAGFEENLKGSMAPNPEALKPLGIHLRESIPVQVYTPGEISAYSNYSAALAGYIVERVSGTPFDSYMERHIFNPLGMRQSTSRIPPPAALASSLSKGYLTASDPPGPFELDQLRPAGSLSSTVTDMARFMIAHLDQGRGLMRPETAQQMHYSPYRAIPALNGISLGFFQDDRNGHYGLRHGGDSQYFFNELIILPKERVGLFIALNSAGENGGAYPVMNGLIDQFFDRYFPAPRPQERTVATALDHAALIAGHYEGSRRIESSFMSLVYAIAQQTDVVANQDGTISVLLGEFQAANGKPKKWREIAPFVWREVGGTDLLAAKLANGRVASFGTNSGGPTILWLPVPAYRSSAWNVPMFFVAAAILLLTLLAWPITWLVRRHYGAASPLGRREMTAYRLSRVGAAVHIVFILGWMWVFMSAINDLSILSASLDPWIRLLQAIGLIGCLGAIAAIYYAWLMWTKRRDWLARIWSLLLAGAQVAMVWIAFVFHFITLTLRY